MAAANDIFQIISSELFEGKIVAAITVNEQSEIFKGHFPGQPIVPGACMLQLVKEVLEDALKSPFQLKKADQIKFIAMITPENTGQLVLEIVYRNLEDGVIKVNAKLSAADVVCFKFQGSFR